ncbi:hypothetical protein BDN70DRAFT_872148 [Pholiota conissans]|uniref:Uncharacterized protein n=1 Tax=Pholiota conissans TaxID=109636 RepID=A0A9P5ZDG0_9AGAR|nr:hypothetical protein BDN70DRAFT_872148 [Pholiota conissans]
MAHSFASVFLTLFCLLFVVSASPLSLVAKSALDVFVPRIIKPDASTVWVIGQQATVVWDTSDAPESISNGASVYLHNFGTVAKDFDLRAGNVTFLVPYVLPGSYYITLFGDSGNYSPVFTIVASETDIAKPESDAA